MLLEVGRMIIPILQMRQVRHRELTGLIQRGVVWLHDGSKAGALEFVSVAPSTPMMLPQAGPSTSLP